MALRWDTCQHLDIPNTTSFTLPDLIDMELQQSFSLDHNAPSIDSIFHTNTEDRNFHASLPEPEPSMYHCSYPYLYPQQTLAEPKPFLANGLVDFSTTDDKLFCLSECLVDFSTGNEKMFPLSDDLVDFSANVEKLPDFRCQMPPPVFNIGSGGGTLSAQSVAARQRRRKITERTQELGKLVPGGNKMNTAEMFGAAYDYIKFLQSQVGILQLLHSTKENEGEQVLHSEELQKLASSSKIQEKLYSHEKCLVPKQLVDTLAHDRELRDSNPIIAKEIQELIRKSG